MLAEDANLLPDRLLSSLLCLSHRDEHLADIQGSTKLAATRRNASGHTRREEAGGNTIQLFRSERKPATIRFARCARCSETENLHDVF